MHRSLPRLLVLLAALSCADAFAQQTTTVYRGAQVWPGNGPPIEDGVVVIVDGRIQAVGGADTAVPDGAEVVDVTGKVITPGLIDAAWNGGLADNDKNEQGEEVTPAVKVTDGIDPNRKEFVRARQSGVTAVHVMPGTKNVIGGLSAVLKTDGETIEDMLLRDGAALRIALGAEPSRGNRAIRGGRVESIYYRRPTTRMGVVWAVRKSFYDAQDYQQRTIKGPADQNGEDRGMEVLSSVLQGKLTAITTARSEQDLRTALRLAEEFGYTTVIDEAQDAHYVIDELAEAEVWVMVGAPSADRVAGSAGADGAAPRYATLPKLAAAGVPFVITTGTNSNALELIREAMFAVRFGIDPQEALAAVTSRPAQLLSIDDRVGTLQPGRDADLVIWSASPFDPTSEPSTVLIGGVPATAQASR